jgi:hypothetical protein
MLQDPAIKSGLPYQPLIIASLSFLMSVIFAPAAFAAFGDCPSGYNFQRMSGVGCVQTNCASIPNAHLSYEGYCICGSAGSINENPKDPNKRCALPHEDTACPDCVYACVHNNEPCPKDASPVKSGENPKPTQTQKTVDEQERIINLLNKIPLSDQVSTKVVTAGLSWDSLKGVVKTGFGAIMKVLGWGLNKTTDYELTEDPSDTNSGWAGRLIAPDGDWVEVKVFEGRLELSWEKGVAAEFNLIAIKGRPSNKDWINGFSIGIGPGAINKDEADHEIPGAPISPNINIEAIREYFNDKWEGTKSWWQENVPWPLGGANAPNVGGGQ